MIQISAIYALGNMKELPKEYIPLIVEKINSKNNLVQETAIAVLKNMEELPKEYIPLIAEKTKSNDSSDKRVPIEVSKNTVTLDGKTTSTIISSTVVSPTALDAKRILGILSPIYKNTDRNVELRFLAHLTSGGKEDVEILMKWIGEPEKNKPQKLDHELAIKTLKIFSEVWEASKAYKKLNEDLAQQIATVISMKDIRWTPEDLDILKAHETHLIRIRFQTSFFPIL